MLTNRAIAEFCSQLCSLLASGLPLAEALEIIRGLSPDSKSQARLQETLQKIRDGEAFSAAARNLLPPLVTGSLRAAEGAGSLETSLDQLADFYRGKAELEEKLKGALVYPCFVVTFSLLILIAMFVFVLPGFSGLFADLGTELPLLTRLLLNAGDHWYIAPAVIIAGSMVVKARFLTLPVISRLYKQELLIQGLGSLGALIGGGVPALESLQTAARSARDQDFRRVMGLVSDRVANGEKMSQAFAATAFFPPAIIQLLRVGESSGQLAAMLRSGAELQSREREEYLRRVTALLEPAMTLMVGAVVGLIVLALFLPLMNMISSLQ